MKSKEEVINPIIPPQEQKQDLHFAFDVPKQETIDEVAKGWYNGNIVMDINIDQDLRGAFIRGAKHQSEKMFSNEEVEKVIYSFIENLEIYNPTFKVPIKDWLTQHKKH